MLRCIVVIAHCLFRQTKSYILFRLTIAQEGARKATVFQEISHNFYRYNTRFQEPVLAH
jgi:hypothetical protein